MSGQSHQRPEILIRNKTPIRKNIKVELTIAVTGFETYDMIIEDANVNKVFISQDSYPVNKITLFMYKLNIYLFLAAVRFILFSISILQTPLISGISFIRISVISWYVMNMLNRQ